MIIVLVPHKNLPSVFEATREAIIAMAADAGATSHTSSVPPGVLAGDFETAWGVLTKDLRCARRFDEVDDAIAHYRQFNDELTLQLQTLILTALGRLKGGSARR